MTFHFHVFFEFGMGGRNRHDYSLKGLGYDPDLNGPWCGWYSLGQAMVYTLPKHEWPDWLTRLVGTKRIDHFCSRSKRNQQLLVEGVFESLFPDQPLRSFTIPDIARFVDVYPKLRVLPFQHNRTINQEIVRKIGTGREFNIEKEPENYSLCLFLDNSLSSKLHVVFVQYPHQFQTNKKCDQTFCQKCFQAYNNRNKEMPHVCIGYERCKKCMMEFVRGTGELKKHQQVPNKFLHCNACTGKNFYNQECLDYHMRDCRTDKVYCPQCARWHPETWNHNHGGVTFYCKRCKFRSDKEDEPTHKCMLRQEKIKEEKGDWSNIWAYDIECMLVKKPDSPFLHHEVNLIMARNLADPNSMVNFKSWIDFIDWLAVLPIKDSANRFYFFAHNGAGYDQRMLFEYLWYQKGFDIKCVWAGMRLLELKVNIGQTEEGYREFTFYDSMCQIAGPLSNFRKTFNLGENMDKLDFPHAFNTPENQNYIGPWPAIEYYNMDLKPDEMTTWVESYNKRKDSTFDLQRELRFYCAQDVNILAEGLLKYAEEAMKINKGMNPLKYMTIAQYAYKVFMTLYYDNPVIADLEISHREFARKALHGGRTDVRQLIREYTEEELENGIYGRYQDVCSLYPTVQYYDPMPIGVPETETFSADNQPSIAYIKKVFGFIECDLVCERLDLYHPVIVDYDTESGKLRADLHPKKKIVVTSIELQVALTQGYKITHVYRIDHYEQSRTLFKDYIRTYVEIKTKHDKKPSLEQWAIIKSKLEELDIHLEYSDLDPNPVKKQVAKLMLNSLWGKFGQREIDRQFKKFSSQADFNNFFDTMLRENTFSLLDTRFAPEDTDNLNGLYGYCIYEQKKKAQYAGKNVAIAAFVTAHARLRLWEELENLGERVLYHDTDSIIYTNDPNGYNIKCGHVLGEWTDELEGDRIEKFVSLGPKTYAYVTSKGKKEVKAKGVPLKKYSNAQVMTYENYKNLLFGEKDKLITEHLQFQYARVKIPMRSRSLQKLTQFVYDKNWIDWDSMKTLPFGSVWHLESSARNAASPPESEAY